MFLLCKYMREYCFAGVFLLLNCLSEGTFISLAKPQSEDTARCVCSCTVWRRCREHRSRDSARARCLNVCTSGTLLFRWSLSHLNRYQCTLQLRLTSSPYLAKVRPRSRPEGGGGRGSTFVQHGLQTEIRHLDGPQRSDSDTDKTSPLCPDRKERSLMRERAIAPDVWMPTLADTGIERCSLLTYYWLKRCLKSF